MVTLSDILKGRNYTIVDMSSSTDMNIELTWLKQNIGLPVMELDDGGRWTAEVLVDDDKEYQTIRYYFFNEDDALHFKLSI